ncbi:MAG TPA: LptF/LptG family permease, partial [Atribacteraceae bacterium]|nr:LptF/LptG family permease [Atribacteraceae bacterium]
MKTIDRYILGQTAVHFLFGVALFVTILTAGDLLFRLTRLWLQSGLSLVTVLQIFLYSIPSFLVYVFPMAVLLAVLLTMSRLASGSEVIALKAGGVSLKRIALPFIFFAVWVCSGTILISEWLLPVTAVRLEALAGESALPDWLMQENIFFKDTSETGVERVFYVRRIDRDRSILEDVI